jgi:hypothetical protein
MLAHEVQHNPPDLDLTSRNEWNYELTMRLNAEYT